MGHWCRYNRPDGPLGRSDPRTLDPGGRLRFYHPSRLHPAAPAFDAAVVCADTDDRARWLAGPGALSFLRLRAGRPGPLPSPEEAAAYPYNELERAFVQDRQATQVIGAPETVRRGLADLLEATAADELMLTTMVFDPADRLRSFELVADLARTAQPLDAS